MNFYAIIKAPTNMTHKSSRFSTVCPYYSSRFSTCQVVRVEFSELCQPAQFYRGVIMFYDRFVYLCKQKGVSVSRGALDAGISKSLVTKWKSNGTKTPSADVIEKLCKYFNMTLSELLDEENEKAPTEISERKLSKAELRYALWGDSTVVDDDDLNDVLRYAAFIEERKRK